MELRPDLFAALDKPEQFHLVYQPIFDLERLSVVGVEALLRWRHPTRGVLDPDVFIGLAEDKRHRPDRRMGDERSLSPGPPLADPVPAQLAAFVNLSARQLQDPGIAAHVQHALQDSGLDPAHLVLEITESATIRDPEAGIHRLHQVKALGVRLAMDDFGTGYSSRTYFQRRRLTR